MRRRFVCVAVVCALGAALYAGPAIAAGISPPAADCLKNGHLTHPYSVPELQHALQTLPASVSEYSNCSAVIQQALNAKIHIGKGGGGNGSGGDSFLPTWLLIVLIVLVLGAVAFVAAAVRRRGTPE